MTSLYLGWGRSNAWGVALAEDLGAKVVFTEDVAQASVPISLGRRYWRDFWISRRVVGETSPDLVIWQVPPTVAPIAGSFAIGGIRWGIDMHSGGVNLGRWRWLLPLLRLRARTASFTVAHNEEIADLLRPWPSPVFVIKNYVVPAHERPPQGVRTATGDIVVVASGAVDEPLHVVMGAAKRLGGRYTFLLTGRPDAIVRRLGGESAPPNVRLTGFLDRPAYLRLLATASMTVCLTTRPATMQLGAWEAASLGCPVVVSDQTVLRRYFTMGAQFCRNSAVGLATALTEVRESYESYLTGAEHHSRQMIFARSEEIQKLREYLLPS